MSALLFAMGGVLAAALLAQGVRRLRRLKAELRQARAEQIDLAGILEQQTELVARVQPDRRFSHVNAALCRYFGQTRQALLGSTWRPVIHVDDQAQWPAAFERITPASPSTTLCCRVHAVQGLRWTEWVVTGRFDAQGHRLDLLCVGRDVHERESLRRTVAERSLELADLYDHAPCGYMDLGPDGSILRINATLLTWLGCAREGVVGCRAITDFLTEEGRAAFARERSDFVRTGVFVGLDVDIVDATGRSRRVRLEANAVRNERGEFLLSRTVLYDVSEAHALRLRMLALLDEQYAMLDNELVGIARLRQGHIVWANRAVHRVFGYAYGQLIGQAAAVLYADAASRADLYGAVLAAMDAAGHCRLQVQMRHQSGQLLWIDLSGSRLEAPVQGSADADTLWMMTDITELQEHRLLSEHQARHDALTGLPNRRLLQDRLIQALARAERSGRSLAVCVVDLDGFKPINDTHGHAAGDVLLQTVARRMQSSVRTSDTVSRSGGDEFIVLLEDLEDRYEHLDLLIRMRHHIAEPVAVNGEHHVAVTASMGVAVYPVDGHSTDELLAHADGEMYHAKHHGHDEVWLHSCH